MNQTDTDKAAMDAARELFQESNLEDSCYTKDDQTECEELFAAIIREQIADLRAEHGTVLQDLAKAVGDNEALRAKLAAVKAYPYLPQGLAERIEDMEKAP